MNITMQGKYTTRDGRAVRILCIDGPGEQPIVGIVEGEDGPDVWAPDGTWDLGYENSQPKDRWNLIPVPTKHEAWGLIAPGTPMGNLMRLYATRNEVDDKRGDLGFGSVAHVTWEDE